MLELFCEGKLREVASLYALRGTREGGCAFVRRTVTLEADEGQTSTGSEIGD